MKLKVQVKHRVETNNFQFCEKLLEREIRICEDKSKMIKWIKIGGNQYFGFWIFGLLLFALQEVPYMAMPLFKLESNSVMNMQESSAILDIAEKILGSLCIAIMIFLVQENRDLVSIGKGITKIGFYIMIISLLLNFFGWGLYFNGHQSFGVIMFFLVALPPLYYAGIGLWRENWVLLGTSIIFEIVHFIHVYGNLKI